MKILFAIKRLENMAGGAERVILQVIEGLRRDYGHDITLVTFDRQGADSFYPVPDGLTWIRLGVGDSARRAGFIETIQRVFALRRLVAQSGAEMVVPFQHSMFVPMVLAMVGFKTPIVASEHIVPDHYRSRPLEYLLLVLTGLRCRTITVLSDAIIKMYPKCLQSRMVAVPNPVAMSAQAADVVGGARKTLISVGRLDPQKDQKTLIAAFGLISAKFPDWDLKIFGEGRLRPELERQISELGLQGRAVLAGVTSDILGEYKKAQAFVLASLYEAYGLATAEAMSAGLPVIGFADCAGTNELIVPERNGLLAEVLNGASRAESLSVALSRILEDSDLRAKLGQQGRADMQALSSGVVVEKWQKLLLSAI